MSKKGCQQETNANHQIFAKKNHFIQQIDLTSSTRTKNNNESIIITAVPKPPPMRYTLNIYTKFWVQFNVVVVKNLWFSKQGRIFIVLKLFWYKCFQKQYTIETLLKITHTIDFRLWHLIVHTLYNKKHIYRSFDLIYNKRSIFNTFLLNNINCL